jgi:hypothetical protein
VRQRAAIALAIGALVIGSILTWSSYLNSSSPPYTDSDYQEWSNDQGRALRNVFNRYIDLIESRDPEAARLFYREYGERSKSEIRGRLSKLLMGSLDKYGNVHGYEVTSIRQFSITSEVSERKRLVVFNCEWLKTGYHFTREDCRSDADELLATHPLQRLIEEESRLVREKLEERWLLDKELASIKALHHLLWTLTASLLLFVSTGLVRRLLIFKRGLTSTDE